MIAVAALPALATARRRPRRPGPIVPNLARVLSPGRDALTRHRRARIVVRVPAPARRFQILLDGRDVSGKFARRGHRGRLRVATFTGLRPGPHSVFVAVLDHRHRQGFDRRTFISGRRAPGLFSLGPIAPHDPAAPIQVSFGARRRPLAVIARLNGKPIDQAFGRTTRRRVEVALSATHGMRPGRNRLRVIAYCRDGSFEVESRSFEVARGRPLAGAGWDRFGQVGRVVRLDGRSSRSGRGAASFRAGARLSYRWRLTKRPPGSHAVLRGETRARPTLVPDRPGEYRASLVVGEAGSIADAATASAEAPLPSSAPDTVVVEAQPPWGPLGAAVATNATAGSGISIGGQVSPAGRKGGPAKGVQAVVVKRDDPRDVLLDETYPGNTTGMGELKSALAPYASNSNPLDGPYEFLVLVAGTSPAAGQPPVSSSAASTFADAVGQIGVQMCSGSSLGPAPCLPQSTVTGAGEAFSIIGVPASAAGSAWVAPGNLTGWLQLDQSGVDYTFVQPDNVPFHTTTGATQAGVTIGEHTYTSVSLPSGSYGLMVIPLNPYTLELQAEGVATLPLSGGSSDVELATRVLTSLADGPPTLVAIQSIGSIVPGQGGAGNEDWGQLAKALEALGGTGDVFLRLDNEPYALLGGKELEGGQGAEAVPRMPVSPPELQEAEGPGIPGTLNGLLSRRPDWRFAADTVDPTDLVDYTLLSVAENPPVAWPLEDPAHEAANSWIARQMEHDGVKGLCPEVAEGQLCDLREAYVKEWKAFDDPDTVLEMLKPITCPGEGGEEATIRFTFQDCAEMVEQFRKEWPTVARVREYVGEPTGGATLQAPLAVTERTSSSTLVSATRWIEEGLYAGVHPSAATVEGVALFGEIFNLASNVFGVFDGLEAQTLITGTLGGLGNIAGDAITGADGSDALVGTVNAKADQLIEESVKSFSASAREYSHIADLIVSDWGKLQAAAGVENEWKTPDTEQESAIQTQIQAVTLKWFYTGLLPSLARTYDLGDREIRSFYCGSKHGETIYPFEGTANQTGYQYALNAELKPSLTITGDWVAIGRSEVDYAKGNGSASLPEQLTLSLAKPFDSDYTWSAENPYAPVGFYQPWLTRWVTGPASGFNCEEHG